MENGTEEIWTELRRARDRRLLADPVLVLEAMRIPHRTEYNNRMWRLLVPFEQESSARSELERYEAENRYIAPYRPKVHTFDKGWAGVLGFLTLIWLLPNLEDWQTFGWNWRELGVMNAELVREGQWWRTVTALTLHGDLGHIIGNSAFGAVFGLLLGRFVGSGLGWLLVLVGAALANGINAWLQTPPFFSLGASTATFAALGLVGAFVWRRGYLRGRNWRESFAPLFAAIALLVYTGVGGVRTDILAHFLGFAAGVAGGVFAAEYDIRRLGRSGQWIAGGVTVMIIVTAWTLAGTYAPIS